MFNVFAIALVLVALSHQSHQIGKCPDVDGSTPTYYPDPTNCTRFYECNHGLAFLIQCPPHTVFDSSVNVCVYSPDGKCLPEAALSRKVRAAAAAEAPEGLRGGSRLATSCPRQDGYWTTFLRDVHNCRRYYLCSNGKAILKTCPSGLEFNARLLVCDFPSRAGCRPRTPAEVPEVAEALPYMAGESLFSKSGPSLAKTCPKEDGDWPTYLIDPTDCRRFYQCSHGRPVLQRCPPGLVFSTTTLTCDKKEHVNCNRRTD